MSPLSGSYERTDLPVAERQSWTPVPPYIPRIQREKLCISSLRVAPISSPAVTASSWWKVPLWNWKASSSSSSVSVLLSSLSSGFAAAKSQSAQAQPAEEPVPTPSATVLVALGPTALLSASKVEVIEHPISIFPSQTLYNDQENVEMQQHLSRRVGALHAQALVVKQSHDVLSWQMIFSGARHSNPLPSNPLHHPNQLFALTFLHQLVVCCSSPSWLPGTKSSRVSAAAERLLTISWGSSCR
jgi:hypothetical protein